jgi:hypothetical protein
VKPTTLIRRRGDGSSNRVGIRLSPVGRVWDIVEDDDLFAA